MRLLYFIFTLYSISVLACPPKPSYINASLCKELKEKESYVLGLAEVKIKFELKEIQDPSWSDYELTRCDFRRIIQTCDKNLIASSYLQEYMKFGSTDKAMLEEAVANKLTQYFDPNDSGLNDLFAGNNFFYKNNRKEELETAFILYRGGYVPQNFEQIQNSFYNRLTQTTFSANLENEKNATVQDYKIATEQVVKLNNLLDEYFLDKKDRSDEVITQDIKKMFVDFPILKDKLKLFMPIQNLYQAQILSGIDLKAEEIDHMSNLKDILHVWSMSGDKWNSSWQKKLDFYLNLKNPKSNIDYLRLMKQLVEIKEKNKNFSEELYWQLFKKLDKEQITYVDKKELVAMLFSLNRVDWVKTVVDDLNDIQGDIISIAKGLGWCVNNKSYPDEELDAVDAKVIPFYQKYYQDYRNDKSSELIEKLSDPSISMEILFEEFKNDFNPKAQDKNKQNIFHHLLLNKTRSKSDLMKLVKEVCSKNGKECMQATGFINSEIENFKKNYKPNTDSTPLVKAIELGDIEVFKYMAGLRQKFQPSNFLWSEGATLIYINSKNLKEKNVKKAIKDDPYFSKTLESY